MVVAGNFSARLVDAATKVPFKEHVGPNGEVYAEVEPEAEYLIELQIVGGDQKAAFHCFIDGKRLPDKVKMKPMAPPYFRGLRERSTGNEMAFCFRSPTILQGGSSSESAGMMGSVTVQASEMVPLGSKPRRTFTQEVFRVPPSNSTTNVSSSLTGNVSSSPTSAAKATSSTFNGCNGHKNGGNYNGAMENSVALPFVLAKKQEKKVLRTVAGNVVEPAASMRAVAACKPTMATRFITASPKKKKKYTKRMQTGDILQEININYCTALGLIHAGILTKPALWEQHRLTRGLPKNERDGGDSERIAPSKTVKIDAIFAGDTMISDAREVEIFDLTSFED